MTTGGFGNPVLYSLHDANQALANPVRLFAEALRATARDPIAGVQFGAFGRSIAAGAEVLESVIRPRGKPAWGIAEVLIDGAPTPIAERVIARQPFCHLIRFEPPVERAVPKVLLVAPMSGHHATLLRGTVEALLVDHDVYITDWLDAKLAPLSSGAFGLDDYTQTLIDFMRLLAPDLHVIGVCQPAPVVLSAVALLAAMDDPAQPSSMTLMGGPVDARRAETEVTRLAETRPLSWFERNLISQVPMIYPGRFRRVYPGFLQLTAFIAMNPARHMDAHYAQFKRLVQGDEEGAEAHRKFYDEYLAVMDVDAQYYLETVRAIFQEHLLARGLMMWKGQPVDPAAISKTALMTVEGELDDISAPGQTIAAHGLCPNLPDERKTHHLQTATGHYGIFNGGKWRTEIKPRIAAFIRASAN